MRSAVCLWLFHRSRPELNRLVRAACFLPDDGVLVFVELRGILDAGRTEDAGNPRLFLGRDEAFAVAALVEDGAAGKAVDYALLDRGGNPQRQFFEQFGHAFCTALGRAGAVVCASAVGCMPPGVARVDTRHERCLCFSALQDCLCGQRSEAGAGFRAVVRTFEAVLIILGDVF